MRLMIADDEQMTRESLLKLIPWSTLGISEVILACDGKDALDIANRKPPDILLTDVRMPLMAGVELAHFFARLYPRCKVLFLSGYSEKEYLVNAIRLKASAFIEKPIDPDEVAAAIANAVKEVLRERLQEKQEEERKSLLGTAFLWNLLSGNLTQAAQDAAKIDAIHSSIHWSADSVRWLAISAYVRNQVERETLYNDICLLIDKGMACICVSEGFVHMLINDDDNLSETAFLDYLKQTAINVNIGISKGVGGLKEASRLVSNSMNAAKNAFFFDKEMIDIETTNEEPVELPNLPTGSISHPDETAAVIKKTCARFRKDGFWTISTAKECLYKMAETIAKDAQIHRISPFPLSTEVSELWHWINRHVTLNEAESDLLEALWSFAGLEEGSAHIREALRYIETNLGDHNLSLTGMAEHLNLNVSYLSSLFHKEMDQTIVNYITAKRMALARHLLDEQPIKTQDVAIQVGYADTAWFIKRFKQAFGMTPKEYKEKCCR